MLSHLIFSSFDVAAYPGENLRGEVRYLGTAVHRRDLHDGLAVASHHELLTMLATPVAYTKALEDRGEAEIGLEQICGPDPTRAI